jgi:hypothetical protein
MTALRKNLLCRPRLARAGWKGAERQTLKVLCKEHAMRATQGETCKIAAKTACAARQIERSFPATPEFCRSSVRVWSMSNQEVVFARPLTLLTE